MCTILVYKNNNKKGTIAFQLILFCTEEEKLFLLFQLCPLPLVLSLSITKSLSSFF